VLTGDIRNQGGKWSTEKGWRIILIQDSNDSMLYYAMAKLDHDTYNDELNKYRQDYINNNETIWKTYPQYHCHDHNNAGFEDLDRSLLDQQHVPNHANTRYVAM